MSKVVVMDHPLIQHKIGIIRREETGAKELSGEDAFKLYDTYGDCDADVL